MKESFFVLQNPNNSIPLNQIRLNCLLRLLKLANQIVFFGHVTHSNQSETRILITCIKLTNQIAELINITFSGLLPKRKVLLSIYGKFNLMES